MSFLDDTKKISSTANEINNDRKRLQTYWWLEQNMDVIIKLVVFTAALFILPIVTYYLTLNKAFHGNATYAAVAAVGVANAVVVAYIITAFFEKQKDKKD
ncbi:hypothetical protein BDF20DRAFT_911135 [Mycotypha africana]|uniref:uncharacterized protein n=1 Tax=Mycotypha africana TaxID=64632 RepID=UPI002300A2AA|nr:uncharacterized protein BDF20DRAFT_911135 [Mycotypha africana]KAI8983949.1 hypothetical protein BDF20DRAFT_911135 [Mycotypha africana]